MNHVKRGAGVIVEPSITKQICMVVARTADGVDAPLCMFFTRDEWVSFSVDRASANVLA